jgi:predicted nucleotidyltransferase
MMTPEIAKLINVAELLGGLTERLVFVGGASVPLLITDPVMPPVRATKDFDFIVEVLNRQAYADLERQLESIGFKLELDEKVVCRFRGHGHIIDVMPSDPNVLGFRSQWFQYANESAWHYQLADNSKIKVIDPVLFLATKLDAYRDRGKSDIYGSHDLEDIVAVLNGRQEMIIEIEHTRPEVREYVITQMRELVSDVRFKEAMEGHLGSLDDAPGRVDVLIERWRQMCDIE